MQTTPRCSTSYAPADPTQYRRCRYKVQTQVHTQVHTRNMCPEREVLQRIIRVEVLPETGELMMRWKVRGFR